MIAHPTPPDDGLNPWPTPERENTVRVGSADDGDLVGACMVTIVPTVGFWVCVWVFGWMWPVVGLVATSLLITAVCVGKEKGWKLPRFSTRRSSSRRP